MIYYPQFNGGIITQKPYTPAKAFKTSSNELDSGYYYAWAWRGAGVPGYPTGPLMNWDLPYSALTDAEVTILENFFVSMLGKYGQFIYLDPAGNLVANSQDFSNALWTPYNAPSVSASGVADPFGGTEAQTLVSAGTNSMLTTSVLPVGSASGFVLCVSAWVCAHTTQNLYIGLIDSGFGVLGGTVWPLVAGVWRRIYAKVTLATSLPVSMLLGGLGSWSGTSIDVFGPQCVAGPGPGGYARTPGNYGYHTNCRFDMDTITFQYGGYNKTAVKVTIAETN